MLSPSRLQALLAYLVLNRGGPVSRRQLAYLFWPDSSEAQARTDLRRGFYNLRRALPDPGQERVRASYGENYDRLAQVKAEYDPQNFCHVHQNIGPAA